MLKKLYIRILNKIGFLAILEQKCLFSNVKSLLHLTKIHDFFSSGKKIEKTKTQKSKEKTNYNKKDLKIVKQINDLLDQRIKPAVAQDGGDISFVKFENGIVFLELQGACSGCPSSTITLKSGIENMLKYYIPEIVSVEAVNQN